MTAAMHHAEVAARYTLTAMALHWLIALAILAQVFFGWYLDEVARGTPARSWYVNLHKSIGLTLGLLIVLRLFWRWLHRPPALPDSIPAWQRTAASVGQVALYGCMLLMPFTGYVASNFSRYGVRYFNAIVLPPWGIDDKQVYALFNGAHVATSYLFVALIVVHLLGALRHVVLRDGLFERMWPAQRDRRAVGSDSIERRSSA